MDQQSFVIRPMRRAFVAELKQIRHLYKENPDEEKSVKLALLPTGEEASRVFLVGVIDDVEKKETRYTAKFRDNTGVISMKIGEFQPDALMQIRKIKQFPAYVAISAKIDIFKPEVKDGMEQITVVMLVPDDISLVEKPYRELWSKNTIEETRRRWSLWKDNAKDEIVTKARKLYPDEVRLDIIKAIQTAFPEVTYA